MKKNNRKHKPLTLLLVLFLSVTLFFVSSISVFAASVIPNHVQVDKIIPVLKVSDLDSVSLKFINDYLADGSKYFVTVKGEYVGDVGHPEPLKLDSCVGEIGQLRR